MVISYTYRIEFADSGQSSPGRASSNVIFAIVAIRRPSPAARPRSRSTQKR